MLRRVGSRDAPTLTARRAFGRSSPPDHRKAGVVPFRGCRGHCVPLWAVSQPLQVVLSSACSVASLSRFPNRYLPGHPYLRGDAPADYLFGKGSPSTQHAGRTAAHGTPSATPEGTERPEPPRMCNIQTNTPRPHIIRPCSGLLCAFVAEVFALVCCGLHSFFGFRSSVTHTPRRATADDLVRFPFVCTGTHRGPPVVY